jgi:threonine synthase
MATIAATRRDCGIVIDPHTADGLKAARAHLNPGVPMIVLETALAAKFADAVHAATGEQPPRPARFIGLEALAQHFTRLPATTEAVRRYMIERLGT